MMRTQHAAFPATRWSVVLASRKQGESRETRIALEELCSIYWHPLYSYARHQGISAEDAEDLTQSFLVFVLEKDLFSQADAALGRLRNYLLTAFGRHIKHWHRQAGALKRGGGHQIVSIEASREENSIPIDPADHRTPEEIYQRQCALSMIETALEHLAQEQDRAGKAEQFELLRTRLDPTLSCTGNDAELAAALGMSHDAVRKAISRLRKRFRELLYDLVAATLSNPTEESIQEELASLRNALVG